MECLDKKDIIVKAAEHIFCKFGYNKTSMEDIAAEAGIGKATIYYYFKSKEDIFIEILISYDRMLTEIVEIKIREASTFPEKFKIMIELPLKYVYEKMPLFYDVINSKSSVFLNKIRKFKECNKDNLKTMLRKMFQQGIEEGSLREDIQIETLIDVLTRWFFVGDEYVTINITPSALNKFIEDYKIFTDIILNGIIKRS